MSSNQLLYPRVLVKLSGEALVGDSGMGIDPAVLNRFASDIADVANMGVQIGVVIGGGNMFRGAELREQGMDQVTGDHMGMLATVMNGLAMRDALERIGMPTRLVSAIPVSGIVEHYDHRRVLRHLREGDVVIFCAGTGNPFFTTDSAACLRAIEIQANVMIKATKVDGVYDSDPMLNPDSVKFDRLSYDEAISRNLRVMDMTAISLARDYALPIRVVSLNERGFLQDAVTSTQSGTTIEKSV